MPSRFRGTPDLSFLQNIPWLEVFNRRLVSEAGKAPVCRAGGRGFKPRPDQHYNELVADAVAKQLFTRMNYIQKLFTNS